MPENPGPNNTRPWYTSAWFTVLAFLLFPPLGIFLVLRSKSLGTIAKVTFTAIGVFWLVFLVIPKDQPKRPMTTPGERSITGQSPSVSRDPQAEEREAAMRQEQERIQHEREVRQAQEATEVRRRASEEYEDDGLVLLLKTMKGTQEEFGGEITGIVENRRSRAVGYAQISFNLYDKSGAQVGSAFDNVTNLEPGGRWRFKASTFGVDFVRFKFAELSGF